jgi:hypothetical protein
MCAQREEEKERERKRERERERDLQPSLRGEMPDDVISKS